MSSTHNRIKDATILVDSGQASDAAEQAKSETVPVESISQSEATALRQEKLAAIKAAVDAGSYDSEELLEKAMKRMQAAIESGEERQ